MYRQNENMNRITIEDFTTELLVGILENNNKLLDKFVNNILLIKGHGFYIDSQKKYYFQEDTNCIIDIVIKNEDVICFVENKVGSSEDKRQLNRCAEVLNNIKHNDGKNVYLRYCTKHYDKKNISNIDFLQYRWSDVYKFLSEYKENITINEYLKFLRGEGMDSAGDFNFQDLIVMSEVNATIKKMNECLDMVKPKLTKCFGVPYEYDYARLKQICKQNQYVMWSKNIIGENGYSEITVGFGFDDNKNPVMKVFIYVVKSNSVFDDAKKIYAEKLQDIFDYYFYDEESISYSFEKPISDFISSKKQNEEISTWFIEKIEIINELKNSYIALLKQNILISAY